MTSEVERPMARGGRSQIYIDGVMKMPKMAVVEIKGRQEVGEVVREGKRSCYLRFQHVSGTPTIKMKKGRVIRFLFGDSWD